MEPNGAWMGVLANVTVLADVVGSIQAFVSAFVLVYTMLILAYIITSWVRLPYSLWLNRIQRFLYDVCEPYLRLFRRVLPPLGPIDLSPIVAILTLHLVNALVQNLLARL